MRSKTMMASKAFRIGIATFALALLLAAPALAGARIEKKLALEPGGEFELDTSDGSVEVVGTSGSGARVLITAKIDDLGSKYDIDFQESPGKATVTVKRKGSKISSWFKTGSGMKFQIEVPRDTTLSIDTSGGSISVEEIDAPVHLDTSGGSIDAHEIRGEVNADTSGGSINVARVEGNVNADTSGGGIDIEGVQGDVNADTSGGGIAISDVSGDIKADTSGGGIRISEAGGEVLAETSGGPIKVSFASGNSRGGVLSTSGGGVTVSVDPSANLDIDASTSGGTVTLDLPVTVQGKISRTSVRGALGGGGSTLKLRSSGGGIRIQPR
jgi:DUF4097 and DUF4098 domain-containing protein YvlB